MPEVNRGMSEVVIEKDVLLDKLRANKTKHQKEYEEAVTGYRVAAVEMLEKELARAEKELARAKNARDMLEKELARAKEARDTNGPVDTFQVAIYPPESHLEDYDTHIEMLELSNETVKVLSHSEFQKFVRDNWQWKKNFERSTALYKAKL